MIRYDLIRKQKVYLMKICIWILAFFCVLNNCFSQVSLSDSGTYVIHKNEQPIGKEKFNVTRSGQDIFYAVDFKYIDRGSPVHLKDSLHFAPNLKPVSFKIKGGTSRFTTVNDSVVFKGQRIFLKVDDSVFERLAAPYSFPVAGYAPATGQMLLVKYWNEQHRPDFIPTIPFGSVQIVRDGEDQISVNNESKTFIRYLIRGLIWGNELLWTDPGGQLVCLITNDAEGDKQEMMLESYESLLPVFIEKAALKGMQLFAKEFKTAVVKHPLIAINGGNMIDVMTNKLVHDVTIVIENGIIRKIGRSASVSVPANAFIVNAKGKTILPGLWDMHAHFSQAEWGPAYLASGVTTVRDCGNEFGYINAIQKAIDEGAGVGPHILKAGIVDGKGPFALGIIQADTREEAIAVVRRYKDNGFVQIKIYSSVKPAILKVICDEAHRVGLTVTGHIPIGMNLFQAVDSGMDMVNHLQFVAAVMKKNKTNGLYDFSDSANISVLKFIKDHHLVIDPTMGVMELIFRSAKDSITSIEPHFASLPEPLKALFTNMGMTDPKQIEQGKLMMKNLKNLLFALYQDSITIVAGTDMDFPGYSLFRELELYVACGLSPMAAIQSATIVPARVMKMATVTGSIEAGKTADLILVDGNPLENIREIRNVETVIKGGIIYNTLELHQMAGFQKM
jgi:imidazolonepropionase-like amidohydrolase